MIAVWSIWQFGIVVFRKIKQKHTSKEKDLFWNRDSFYVTPKGQMQQVGLDALCKYSREMWSREMVLEEQLKFRWQKSSFSHHLNQREQHLDRWGWKWITGPESLLTPTARDQEKSGFIFSKFGKGGNTLDEELSGCYLSVTEIKDKLEQNAAHTTRGRAEMKRNYFSSKDVRQHSGLYVPLGKKSPYSDTLSCLPRANRVSQGLLKGRRGHKEICRNYDRAQRDESQMEAGTTVTAIYSCIVSRLNVRN